MPEGAPVLTQEQIESGTVDGFPVTFLNGKAVVFVGDTTKGFGSMFLANNAGKDTTLNLAKAKYDPLYGVVKSYETMTADHRLTQEDFMAALPEPMRSQFKCVGTVETWKTK